MSKSTAPPTTRAERLKKFIGNLVEPLREKIDEARRLLAGDTKDMAESRYKLGGIVLEIKTAKTYGAEAVKQFARALGLNQATLYDFTAVADCWDASEFSELAKRKGLYGRGLSFSHLIELAKVTKKTNRNALIDEVLSQGLSVSKLRAKIGSEQATSKPGRKKKVAFSVCLRRIVNRTQSLLNSMTDAESAVEKVSAEQLDEKTIDLLEQAKEKQQLLMENCLATVKRIDAALALAKSAADAPEQESKAA